MGSARMAADIHDDEPPRKSQAIAEDTPVAPAGATDVRANNLSQPQLAPAPGALISHSVEPIK
eukprot:6655410-Pyramimonas_sp.AAC.1